MCYLLYSRIISRSIAVRDFLENEQNGEIYRGLTLKMMEKEELKNDIKISKMTKRRLILKEGRKKR